MERANSPPEKLLIAPIPGMVLFPHSTPKRFTNIQPDILERVRQDKFFIVSPVISNPVIIQKIGTLVRVDKEGADEQGNWEMTVQALSRVSIEKQGLDGEGRPECSWREAIEKPLPTEFWKGEMVTHMFTHMKIAWADFLTMIDLEWSKYIQNEEARKLKQEIERGKELLELLREPEPNFLGIRLDEICDCLETIYLKVPGETNVAVLAWLNNVLQAVPLDERLMRTHEFLSWFVENFRDLVIRDQTAPNGPEISARDLVNILLPDEQRNTAQISQEGDRLNIPEGLEPPSIELMCRFLSQRVIGQERAVRTVARPFNLAKAGLQAESEEEEESPLLSIIGAGPKGVGKTKFAYALKNFLWDAEKRALARAKREGLELPFSEEDIRRPPFVKTSCGSFAGELTFTASNLLGSSAGFSAGKGTQNEQPPTLRPENFPPHRITVWLLDELEKAILNSRDNGAEIIGMLMEILDKGKITNNWGEEVDFTKTIIIATSNIGSREIMKRAKGPEMGFIDGDGKKKHLTDEEIERLNNHIYDVTSKECDKIFLPEFLDRWDRLIVFRFLDSNNRRVIIFQELAALQKRIQGGMPGISLELSEEAVGWLLEETGVEEGVRKLKKFMRKEITVPIARAHNLGMLVRGKTYIVKTKKVLVRSNGQEKEEVHADFYIQKENAGSS